MNPNHHVACRGRYEPKSPCDYRANHCHETSHCIPCWVRYASCLQLPDGLNPWPDLEWKPFFVECYKERTVFQGACDKSAVFSPLTRACETPYSIPRQHGGWRPVCDSRRDGIYADEYGRCDIFYVCKNFDFAGFFRCDNEQMFDPLTSTCQGPSTVPYPCGDLEMPNLCELLLDGKYMDMFGRCTHYFECKNRKLKGISMCPTGIFNPETRNCDTSKDIPKPCGLFDNPCTHEDDGFVTDPSVCTKVYLCERGLTMASFDCDKNITCVGGEDVSNMCMIPPDCTNKLDGFYPDIQNGVDVYYTCESNAIQRHYTCNREKGGTVFIPSKQRCDFPEDLCYDLYRFPNKC
ncbi:uncharacterized protein LOC126817946 [Patella vulgata]|uniref:uncharacterized protein LOC126817946 n=1 Tax=Patella vulgata TaxID=6465 RepID=UPI0021804669|nr:uncharacterized protein LOC126817946 [Patella vulgata]